MRYRDIITEGRDALLYHGYQKSEHASTAMASGKMAATSTQRFWADGRRRTEDEPDYHDSYWMKGVSFTRNIRYAMQWGDIVIAVDQAKLTQRTKVVPFSWGYHMANQSGIDFRREGEEFAIVKATPDTYQYPDDDDRAPGLDINRFTSQSGIEGYIPLTPILAGIWLHVELASLRGPKKKEWSHEHRDHIRPEGFDETPNSSDANMKAAGFGIDDFVNHPMFRGYYAGGRRGDGPWQMWPASTPRTELPIRRY